jgi:hypothetical protein
MQHLRSVFQKIGSFYQWFISGIWFVSIMRQVIVTGGNIAESAFLIATLWVIVNAVAHTLLTWFMPTHTIELFNYLAVIAFSALPELIIIPVAIVCFSHWTVAIKQKDFASGVWAVLYSVPAVFFLVMTILAITTFVSTGGNHFVPASGIELVIRCLSGWMYAVVNMLFQKLGEPHYASRFDTLETDLAQSKREIERLTSHFETAIQTANSNFQTAMQSKQHECDSQINEIMSQAKSQIESLQNEMCMQVEKLSERASSLERDELALYPKVQCLWIEKAKRTVSIDEIADVTGLSKQRIRAAVTSGKIVRDNRNKDVFRVASVIEWLKNVPVEKTNHSWPLSLLKPQDTDPLPATNGHRKITQPLDNLVELRIGQKEA